MATKRSRRRLDRRRQHQATAGRHRRELRQQIQGELADLLGALREVVRSIGGDGFEPTAFAERLVEVLDMPLAAIALCDPDHLAELGETIAGRVEGEERLQLGRVARALASRDQRLGWVAAGLLAGTDPTAAAHMAEEALVCLATDREGPDGSAHGAPEAVDTLVGGSPSTGRARDSELVAGAGLVAMLQRDAGQVGAALETLHRWCAEFPDDHDLQEFRAVLMRQVWRRLHPEEPSLLATDDDPAWGQDQLDRAMVAITAFADGSRLRELRSAVHAFAAGDPHLSGWLEAETGEFAEMVRSTSGRGSFDEPPDGGADVWFADAGQPLGMPGMIAEWAWVRGPDRPDGGDPSDDESVLGLFAASAGGILADDARSWIGHALYGLWRPELGDPGTPVSRSPGIWVTDILTRCTRYAAIDQGLLGRLARWSVLCGPLIPVDGVWRPGAGFLLLDPKLADEIVGRVTESAAAVVTALAREHGIKVRPERPATRLVPYGVLADGEPMEQAEAHMTSRVFGAMLPNVVGLVEHRRNQAPGMVNTDGDPLVLLTATYAADDGAEIRRRLLAMADFVEAGNGDAGDVLDPVSWLGREMSAMEAASSLAAARAEAAARGFGPIVEGEGPRRYLRGILRFMEGSIRTELNSQRRLDTLTRILQRAGVHGGPIVESAVDPELDLPFRGRVIPGRASNPVAEAAWREHWLDERLPALDGASPRAAAGDPRRRLLLESLLRTFEHGSDLARLEGRTGLDVGWLRAALGMTGDAFLGEQV